MYPITSAIKSWFDSEKKQIVRITGDTRQRLGDNIDIYSGSTKIYGLGGSQNIKLYSGSTMVFDSDGVKTIIVYSGDRALYTNADQHIVPVHLEITASNIMQDQFSIDRYSSNSDKIEVGTAIASEMTLKLDNRDGKYDGVFFEGAELKAEIGISGDWEAADPAITWIPCGYFTCLEQPRRLNTITLHALDRMTWLDKPVDASQITLPITVKNLFLRCCAICNVPVKSDSTYKPNQDYSITALPDLTNTTVTYRNLVQWCAGMMGSNAWIDWNGDMCLNWYNVTNPNVTYVSTTALRFNSDLFENELSITGVQFVADDENHTKYISGTDDYAIDMSDNALIAANVTTSSSFATVLNAIRNRVGTLRYTPFSASVINAPYLYPMDQIWFRDKNNVNHRTVVTNVNFGVNGATALAGNGLSLKANTGVTPNGSPSAVQHQFTSTLMSTIEAVTREITGANGGHVRFMYDNNGELSEILIMDNSDIVQAQNIWRWNLGGLAHSSNGIAGPFDTAITQSGTILGNFIAAETVSANCIKGGELTLGGSNGAYGKLVIKDSNNFNFGTWDENGINVDHGNFMVSPNGAITAKQATINGSVETGLDRNNRLIVMEDGQIKGLKKNADDSFTNIGMIQFGHSNEDGLEIESKKQLYLISNGITVIDADTSRTGTGVTELAFPVVTGVYWDGSQYNFDTAYLEFVNGILTNIITSS